MTPDPWKGASKRVTRELGGIGWRVEPFGPDGRQFVHLPTRTSIIATRAEHRGEEWLHVSIAHPDRLPTWEELKAIKIALIGAARFAYQVFPPNWQYVNQHPYALHLWARWDDSDGAALPDFVGDWHAKTGELSL
jgi:hypothetical protein